MSRLVSVLVGVMGMAYVASAAPVYFSDDAYSVINGNETFKIEEYGITLTAAPKGAKLTQSSAGLGVDYSRPEGWLGGIIDFPDDLPFEIDYPEALTISFDKEVNLESVFISNLYTDQIYVKILGKRIVLESWKEEGSYELSDGEGGYFITANDNGELTIDINKTVSSISFSAKDGSYLGILHDFSVRGVDFTSIPEPATSVPEPAVLSLLGMSLLGLGFVHNRKK